jgi:hypothetical protein
MDENNQIEAKAAVLAEAARIPLDPPWMKFGERAHESAFLSSARSNYRGLGHQ